MTQASHFPQARAVTRPPGHHFFGYYDKCPWDPTGRFMLALETAFIDRPPTPDDEATIGLIDLTDDDRWQPLARTRAWNWQQGCMLQWLERPAEQMLIHNARQADRYVAMIRNLRTGAVRTLPRPIYAVSRDGRHAVTLNFSRLHRHRPGYGYVGVPDPGADDPHPADDGIFWMDLQTGESRLIISLDQLAHFRPDERMTRASHKVNHLQYGTDSSRFLFLHRWKKLDSSGRWTRLFTANPDGTDLYLVADDDMVSHFDWYNAHQILAFARKKGVGDRFFLYTDRTDRVEEVGPGVLPLADGHCSYSPDRRWIVSDTYPDRQDRCRTLYLYSLEHNRRIDLGRFYSPPEIDGEIRCDLHPRWSRDGRQICFDSVHEGHRQMYVVDVGSIVGAPHGEPDRS